ncbi:MAG: hypothetical protein J5633_03480 [Oscillospiraceae bacterium]|nr:hypothetical protein [Oscillospiraceae bacterium]
MSEKMQFNDPLNLRDLISTITEFIRINGSDAHPKTIIGFLAIILTGSDTDTTRKESSVVTIQRVMSGNIHYRAAAVQKLANDICSGRKDGELLERLSLIGRTIESCEEGDSFFAGRLYKQCSFRFFSADELRTLRDYLDQRSYARFLLALVKHAFDTLYNLPYFFAERMYDEATTCDWDSPHRFALLKLSADAGSRDAAYDYANFLARSRRTGDDSDADVYYMKAVPKPEALWSLVNRIEDRWISDAKVPGIRNTLRIEEKLSGSDFAAYRDELAGIAYGGPEPDRAETMIWMYKVFFFLSYSGFFKGFHSMAKQLETGAIRFDLPDGEIKAKQLRQKYRAAAIKASSVLSLLSEGTIMIRGKMASGEYDPESESERQMLELLSLSADTDLLYGSFRLGEYYEYASRKNPLQKQKYREQARSYYLRAEQLDTDGNGCGGMLWLRMGLISDSLEEKQKYLEKALAAKQWDAAYHLSEIDSQQLPSGKDAQLHLLNAVKRLKKHLPLISNEKRKDAETLYRALSAALDEENP